MLGETSGDGKSMVKGRLRGRVKGNADHGIIKKARSGNKVSITAKENEGAGFA